MNDKYTLTIFLDRKYVSSATLFDQLKIIDLMNTVDTNMKDQGYKRINAKKVRVSRKDRTHITNYSLFYTRV